MTLTTKNQIINWLLSADENVGGDEMGSYIRIFYDRKK